MCIAIKKDSYRVEDGKYLHNLIQNNSNETYELSYIVIWINSQANEVLENV